MAEKEPSESETTEPSSSSDDEPGKATADYEKQRQLRIADNKARMEALGLRNMAISLMGSPPQTTRQRLKTATVKKEEEDEEYSPNHEDEEEDSGSGFSSSGEEFEEKVKGGKPRFSKNISKKKSKDISDIMDEDDALMQAIALSLKDSEETSDMQQFGSSQGSNAHTARMSEKEDKTRRRKRKMFTSRVQMTVDDLIINFCQLDEVGKGSIVLRDLQRTAAIHDFTWTDKELADMIWCFDSDKDGKLSLDDFRNIVMRCKMLQEPENP